MSGIEDQIQQVMAEHEPQAPTVGELLRAMAAAGPAQRQRPGRARRAPAARAGGLARARLLAPLAAAAAVAAIILVSFWAGEHVARSDGARLDEKREGRTQPMPCPARHRAGTLAVPARPAGVDGRARLIPRMVPRAVVLCAYDGRSGDRGSWSLSGRRVLAGGLVWLTRELTWQPRLMPGQSMPCPTDLLGPQTDYLIGLRYGPGRTLWVAMQAPSGCLGASNGEFTTYDAVGPVATKAYASGRWPARRPPSCRYGTLAGRLGQEKVMVPAGSTSLTICGQSMRISGGYQPLVAALNAEPARPSTEGCSELPGKPATRYLLYFSYPQGPPVQVRVDSGCDPAIDNTSLQAPSAGPVLPIIARLLSR